MAQRHHQFRKPFRAVPLRRRPLGEDFKSKVAAGCIVVAVITWQATPIITGEYNGPEAVAQREAIAKHEASVYYSGCNEARAAGAAPIYAGQQGYRREMDGDGDGIACENRY